MSDSKISWNGFVIRYSDADKCWFVVSRDSGRIWVRCCGGENALDALTAVKWCDLPAHEWDRTEEHIARQNRRRILASVINLKTKRRPR